MENNTATRELLSANKRLPKVTERLQRELERGVLTSWRAVGYGRVCALCDDVAELIRQKAECINMKVLVDKATSRITKRQRGLLWYRFIEGRSMESLANMLGLYESRLQREYAASLKSLAFQLKALGFGEEELVGRFGDLYPFRLEYDRLSGR